VRLKRWRDLLDQGFELFVLDRGKQRPVDRIDHGLVKLDLLAQERPIELGALERLAGDRAPGSRRSSTSWRPRPRFAFHGRTLRPHHLAGGADRPALTGADRGRAAGGRPAARHGGAPPVGRAAGTDTGRGGDAERAWRRRVRGIPLTGASDPRIRMPAFRGGRPPARGLSRGGGAAVRGDRRSGRAVLRARTAAAVLLHHPECGLTQLVLRGGRETPMTTRIIFNSQAYPRVVPAVEPCVIPLRPAALAYPARN
jgi:hypothetical protein